MLKVMGLPYVVAPMEAEAQCAELLQRSLVDGVITDDNDVFLFGATKVYKNMFNQNKYVECYLATDIERELALDRHRLIRLAYFLGSDYCDGLPGVGPVLGMELMAEFPSSKGLADFRNSNEDAIHRRIRLLHSDGNSRNPSVIYSSMKAGLILKSQKRTCIQALMNQINHSCGEYQI
jgi:5'-3' exonuclease